MHTDQVGILEYRIRKLEIVLEIIADARVCSSVYAKAGLTRGIFERLLEEDVARTSLPGFLLLAARHNHQDLKILRRSEEYMTNETQLETVKERLAATQKLKDQCEKNAEMLAAAEATDSESLRIYHCIKKSGSTESVAKAVYSTEIFSRFYADYSALSPFVHGGNRETLVVTKTRGDQSPMMLSILKGILDHADQQAKEALNFLRAVYSQQNRPNGSAS